MHRWRDSTDFPQVITIFSAPNYCDMYKNKGAMIKFKNNSLNIQQFNYTSHPFILPHFIDIFAWSVPFISEKVTEMFYNLLKPQEGDNEESSDDEDLNLESQNQVMKDNN